MGGIDPTIALGYRPRTQIQYPDMQDIAARKDAAAARKIELQQRQIQLDQAKKQQADEKNRDAAAVSAYQPQSYTPPQTGVNVGGANLGYQPATVQGPQEFNRGSYIDALRKTDPFGAMQQQNQFQLQDIEHQKQMAALSEQFSKTDQESLKTFNAGWDTLGRYLQAVDGAPDQMKPQIYAQALQHAAQNPAIAHLGIAQAAPPQYDPQSFQQLKSQFMDVKQAADLANKRIDQQNVVRGQDMTAQTAKAGQAVTMRGQNMTDARAREANQIAAGPSSQVTGDAFLQTLPPGTQAQVKAIAEGRMPLPNSRSKQGMAMANAVAQAYPGFDSSKQPAYAATRKTFTAGTVADGINSFNTALNHLGRAYDNLPDNLPLEMANTPMNWLKNQTGSDKKFNRFNSDLTAVTSEVAKAYKKGVITEDERNDWLARLNPNSPTGKLKDNLGEIGQLLMGKLDAYQHQWDEAMPMGAVAPVNIVSKEAKSAFDKITGQAAAPSAATHAVIVNGKIVGYTSDGKTMTAKP